MANYIDKAALVGELLTSSESQQRFREMTGTEAYNEFLRLVNDMPTADVEPVRHGRWESIKVPNEWDKGRCTACQRIFESYAWGSNYCPVCGARMDGRC